MVRVLSISALCVLLAGCAMVSSVPFPLKLPSERVIDTQYKEIRHNLSPLPRYHFEIVVPLNWELLDTRLFDEPPEEEPVEIAAFREPGAWMEDQSVSARAEVAVSVVKPKDLVSGADAARAWLLRVLDGTTPDYRFLKERSVGEGTQAWTDILIRYPLDSDTIIARFRVQPSEDGTHVFVLTATAPADQYAAVAEDLFVALASFRLLGL